MPLHAAPTSPADWTGVLLLAVLVLLAAVVLLSVALVGQRAERDRAIGAALDTLAWHGARRDRLMAAMLLRLTELEQRLVDRDEPWSRPWESEGEA